MYLRKLQYQQLSSNLWLVVAFSKLSIYDILYQNVYVLICMKLLILPTFYATLFDLEEAPVVRLITD